MRVRLLVYGSGPVSVDLPALPRPGDWIYPEVWQRGTKKRGVMSQVVERVVFYPEGVVVSLVPLPEDPAFPERQAVTV